MNTGAVESAVMMLAISLPLMFITIGIFMGFTKLLPIIFKAEDED